MMYRRKRNDFTDDVLPWLDFGVQLIMLYYVMKVCEKEHRQNGKPQTFQFLALPGFAKLHEYQLYSELKEQTEVKRFIFETYNAGTADAPPDYNLLPKPIFDAKKRGELDAREAVRGLFSAYHAWEAATLAEYTAVAVQLNQAGDVAAYQFVAGIVSDVREELAALHNEHLQLMACDFDMPTIIAMQGDLRKKYKKKLRGVLGG